MAINPESEIYTDNSFEFAMLNYFCGLLV